MTEEEKEAINYFNNKEVSFSIEGDMEKLKQALGIVEDDSFEKDQLRIQTLINLIRKQQSELIQKDRIVDETVKKLNQAYYDEKDFWLWFEENFDWKNSLDDNTNEIKQYFEKKVKNK